MKKIKDLLTPEQAAAYAGCSRARIYQASHDQELEKIKLFRRVYFTKKSLDVWLKKMTITTPPKKA